MPTAGPRATGAAPVLVLAVLSAAAYVVLASGLPVAVLASAGHDDAWFWQRAAAIARGAWLGHYDQYTLMKGSGYPLFLAVAHLSGLSVTVAQAVLYSVACLLMGHAVWRIGGRPWPTLLLVLALQWHPAAMAWQRVLRDNVSAAQVLLVLACMLHMLWAARSRRARLAWRALGGWMLAWFWTTREDGIWLLPGLVLLLLVALWQVPHERRPWQALAAGGACMALVFAGWMSLVVAANGIKYGYAGSVDLKGRAFSEALGTLQRVRVGEPLPFVPVPAEVREHIYRESPAFARLRPALDGGALAHWTRPGCEIHAHSCGDYAAGWFMWALRDAVASVGGYRSARHADAYYRTLAGEVARACDEGRLSCERGQPGLMPAVTPAQWALLPASLRHAARLLAWQGVPQPRLRSSLDEGDSVGMWRFVGRPQLPDPPGVLGARVMGWFRDPEGGWIQGRCGSDPPFAIEPRQSLDLVAYFDDPRAGNNRFSFRLPEGVPCAIGLQGGHGEVVLDGLEAPQRLALGAAVLQLDSVGTIPRQAADVQEWRMAVKRAVGASYGLVLPWLAAAGLLAFLAALVHAAVRRRVPGPFLALAACAWGLVGCRALLLALVDISAFPAVQANYMQPAFPLLVLAALVSITALQQQRNPPRPP